MESGKIECGRSAVGELTEDRSVQATEGHERAMHRLCEAIRGPRRERCPEGCLPGWVYFLSGHMLEPSAGVIRLYRSTSGCWDVATQTLPVTHERLLQMAKRAGLLIGIKQAMNLCTCELVQAIWDTMQPELVGQNLFLDEIEEDVCRDEEVIQIVKCRGLLDQEEDDDSQIYMFCEDQIQNLLSEVVVASRNSSVNHIRRPTWTNFFKKLFCCFKPLTAD